MVVLTFYLIVMVPLDHIREISAAENEEEDGVAYAIESISLLNPIIVCFIFLLEIFIRLNSVRGLVRAEGSLTHYTCTLQAIYIDGVVSTNRKEIVLHYSWNFL